jgi:hypothetical protein
MPPRPRAGNRSFAFFRYYGCGGSAPDAFGS